MKSFKRIHMHMYTLSHLWLELCKLSNNGHYGSTGSSVNGYICPAFSRLCGQYNCQWSMTPTPPAGHHTVKQLHVFCLSCKGNSSLFQQCDLSNKWKNNLSAAFTLSSYTSLIIKSMEDGDHLHNGKKLHDNRGINLI